MNLKFSIQVIFSKSVVTWGEKEEKKWTDSQILESSKL